MALATILLAAAAASSLGLYFGLSLHTDWVWFWVPIVALFGFFVAGFAAHIILLFLGGAFINPNKKREKVNRFACWLIHNTCFVLLIVLRVKVNAKGLEQLRGKKGYVLISNHLSMFDQIVMLAKLPTSRVICISKPENFSIPVAGKWIALAGYLPINRESMVEGASVIEKAKKYLSQGISVYVCPEGTRAKDHELQAFHNGTFHLAVDDGNDLVICALRNTWQIKKGIVLFKHNVYAEVLETIDGEKTKGQPTEQIAKYSHDKIAEYLAGWLI